jgi:hypothetical protein
MIRYDVVGVRKPTRISTVIVSINGKGYEVYSSLMSDRATIPINAPVKSLSASISPTKLSNPQKNLDGDLDIVFLWSEKESGYVLVSLPATTSPTTTTT